MKRIDTPTAVDGRFVPGNASTGRKATQFSAEWCNQIQEEIWNFLKKINGSDPSGTSEHELADAWEYFMGHMIRASYNDVAPGSNLLSKLAEWHASTGAELGGDVQFEAVDTRSGAKSALKAHIVDGAVKSEMLDSKAVTTDKINDNAITSDKLAKELVIKSSDENKQIGLSTDGFYVFLRSGADEYKLKLCADKIEFKSLGNHINVNVPISFDRANEEVVISRLAVENLYSTEIGQNVTVNADLNCAAKLNCSDDVTIGTAQARKNLTTYGKVTSDNTPLDVVAVADNSSTWGNTSEWNGAGHHKLLYNTSSSDITITGYFAKNSTGSSNDLGVITIPKYTFVHAICSGVATNGQYVFFLGGGAAVRSAVNV